MAATRVDEPNAPMADSVNIVTENGYYRAKLDIGKGVRGATVAEPQSVEPRGWSFGNDGRKRLQTINVPPGEGLVTVTGVGGCTGALVGLRVVRTAAHCLVKHTTGGGTPAAQNGIQFHYRRDANSNPFPVIATSQSHTFGGNYIALGCGKAKDLNGDGDLDEVGEKEWGYGQNRVACSNEDWALVILPAGWWGANGAVSLGYRTMDAADATNFTHLRAGGYGGCGAADSPANCVPQAYYQDSYKSTDWGCRVDHYVSTAPDFRIFAQGCDSNHGHSGGAIVEQSTGYYLGHLTSGDCTTCTILDKAPNWSLGHNTWLYNYQNQLRAQYP